MRSLLLKDARLVGGDGRPCAVLLERGMVRAIGDPDAAPTGGEVVDLGGRFVMRGLWDHHVHLDQWALARRRLDLYAGKTPYRDPALVVAKSRKPAPRPAESK